MHKSIFLLLIFVSVILVVCKDEQPKWLAVDDQASKDAEALESAATKAYLQCYASAY